MNPAQIIYALTGACIFLLGLPIFIVYARVTGKHLEGLANRLGFYPRDLSSGGGGRTRVWVHAASVGEVAAAAPIITVLAADLPQAEIVLSTTTAAGQAAARESLGKQATCIYAPIDFLASVAMALRGVQPDILVFIETEIWPNWLYLANRAGIPVVLVNGRISVRSIKGYRRIRALIQPVLQTVAKFSVIGEPDAQRLISLGVGAAKIAVNGNAKYDRLAGAANRDAAQAMAALFNVNVETPVLVAGSLRRGEEGLLLDVFLAVRDAVPNLVCIVAPRHLYRVEKISDRAQTRGIDFELRSGLQMAGRRRQAPLVILDTLGELQAVYSIATVVFCGGSLVPLGGQNVLEAAAWAKPVLFGPSMEDFQAEKELLLAAGGGCEVPDQSVLAEKIRFYLTHPEQAQKAGKAGQAMLLANTGAARKHADVILGLLK